MAGKWVLKIKRGLQSEIERFKARYVAKGFTQVHGVDFYETWAPVGRYATLRALLSICAVEDLETKHIDIKCVFLNGIQEEEVYVVQLPALNDGSVEWLSVCGINGDEFGMNWAQTAKYG